MLDDELTLPFIFVADGADPPPELAEFKSAHPDWVSFPATFIPHEQPSQAGEVLRTQPAPEEEWQPPSRKKPIPPQPARTDLGAALRAFQNARTRHDDPVAALRALRDQPPEDFADGSSTSLLTPSSPGISSPSVAGTGHVDFGSQPREPLNAIRTTWQDETLTDRRHFRPQGKSGYPSPPSQLPAPPLAPNGLASGQSDQPSEFRLAAENSQPAIDALSDDNDI